MFDFYIENEYHQVLPLSAMIQEYSISSITGLNPPDAQIYENKSVGKDGNVFNSASLEDRVITVTFAINGPAVENRINLYTYLKAKRKHRLYYRNALMDVYIDGYLESMLINYFEIKEICQITFRCPDPYWKNTSEIASNVGNPVKMFEFPFSIQTPIPFSEIVPNGSQTVINYGTTETGLIAVISTDLEVGEIKLVNATTGEYIGVTTSLAVGEEIIIDTIQKEKSITLKDSDGVYHNLIGDMMDGSSFISLIPGANTLQLLGQYASDSNYLKGYVYVNTLYEGV